MNFWVAEFFTGFSALVFGASRGYLQRIPIAFWGYFKLCFDGFGSAFGLLNVDK